MHNHFDSARIYVAGSNIGAPLALREVKIINEKSEVCVCVCVWQELYDCIQRLNPTQPDTDHGHSNKSVE